ncbi:MAG TPA: DUF4838 domain-containing protein [Gemmatimonadaceae bacterium]|nr:DUF4838 domain-containing protein [Gemmatimonadaceae bacterium]
MMRFTRVLRPGKSVAWVCALVLAACAQAASTLAAQETLGRGRITLASGGKTTYAIALSASPTATELLAASELSAYLNRMTGATFRVVRGSRPAKAVVLRTASSAGVTGIAGDAYAITVRGGDVILTGGSGRAVLYAAYDLLARLGCRWLAPSFAMYEGAAEYVPHASTLVYAPAGDVIERPAFAIRKLDMAGARSHDIESLRRIVEWMPKLRFNTLMVSMISGIGRAKSWDDWRGVLTPELEKRGLTIEVGGHGYQNFLNADMEGGKLFERHPEWFGRDSSCKPSRATHLVFNTSNTDAVAYLIGNVVRYVTSHPEIDVFDFWPPDGARWAECEDEKALGTVEDRHARLVTQLHAALEQARPDLRLEMVAYAHAKMPPKRVTLPADILVDFCPIGQDFDVPIYDPAGSNNATYVRAIQAWRRTYSGDIGLYSYYRKYAWRSLPNVIPHYMQRDIQWYASVPLQGISSYAEPGDWYTYELNHYTLGHLAWNPNVDVDSLIDGYTHVRYGAKSEVARAALAALESSFRLRGSIPYSAVDSAAQIALALDSIDASLAAVVTARESAGRGRTAANLARLALMLEFAKRDLSIQNARARGASPADVRKMVRSLVGFLTANKDRGVFVVYGGDDFTRYLTHYTRDWQAVGEGE